MPLIRKPSSTPPTTARSAPDAAAIRRALVDGTDDERWSAARAAAEIPESVAALGAALTTERNSVVREALLSALARIATEASVAAVLPLLRSDDALVRTQATDALLAMKEAAWPYIGTLLRDSNTDVRVLACSLVREMPRDMAVRLCCERLDSEPEENVCAAIVETLAEVGEPSALPALTRCAERFSATPFLAFSIKVAIERVRSQSPNASA